MDAILDSFADWKLAEHRACDCGSFNVEYARTAPKCVETTAFRCKDCGARWNED